MASILHGTALITGAGSGIGQSTAFAFAGYGIQNLAITDIGSETLQSTVNSLKEQWPEVNVEAIQMDCSSEADIKMMVEQVVKKFERLHIAVSNAGAAEPVEESAKVELGSWQKLMDLNVNGVFLCEREELRQMLKQEVLNEREGRGVIINVASMYGVVASSFSGYTASKHAVLGLTKADAAVYAKNDIRINAICPGYIKTPLLTQTLEPEALERLAKKTPMGRLGKMEEIADSIAFLASQMSSFVTGAGLIVDGGFTAV